MFKMHSSYVLKNEERKTEDGQVRSLLSSIETLD